MSKYISQFNGVASAISGDLFVLQRSSTYKKIDFDDLVSSVSTSIGAGVTTLAELTDVDLTYLSDDDILQYNSSTLKWEAVTLPSSVTFSGSAGYLPRFTSTTDIGNSSVYYASSTTLGFFGVTAPTFSLGLLGTGARSIGVERHTTAATAGVNLTMQAGGAYSTGTNLNGGKVIISGGIATGTGSSSVEFWTATAGASGTTDRTPTLKASITGAGHLNMETSGFIQMNGYTWIHYTNSGTAAPQSNGCTFVGYNVGLSNANNGNSGFGQEALKSVGSGSNNSAFGRFAGTELTNGVQNVFNGYYAGSGITTGSYNVVIGANATGGVSGASYNTAIGNNSMANAPSGSYNVGLGADSCYSVTSGAQNTSIGYNSMNGGTGITGSYNVALGSGAGSYLRTSSAQNTFIGYNTGFLTGEGAFSYSMGIGAGATIRGSNQAVIGGGTNAQKVSTVYFGTSPVYTQGDVTQSTITLTVGGTYYNAGANMGGHNVALCAGLATGAGNAGTGMGSLYLQTTSVTGSGSTLGTATTRMTFLGGTGYAGMQGITAPTAFLHLAASTTAAASLCVPSGTAPSAPVDGDVWSDGSDLKVRLGGATYTIVKV